MTTLFLLLLPLLLTSSTFAISDPCSDHRRSSDPSNDLPIFHFLNKNCGGAASSSVPSSSVMENVLNLAGKDPSRLAFLTTSLATSPARHHTARSDVPIASGQQLLQTPNYVLRARLGSPEQILLMAVDTGADASFVPCSGCSGCPAAAAVFTPNVSTSYAAVSCSADMCPLFSGEDKPCGSGGSATNPSTSPAATTTSACGFNQTYGGDSIYAVLASDTLRLATTATPGFVFGCVSSVSGSGTSVPKQGLLGLGRGPSSLISQGGALFSGVFSYCLPSFRSYYFSGSLRLGPTGQPGNIRTTPLLRNLHRPSLYYVNLTGITVGGKPLAAPPGSFAVNPSTGAGTVVDSGTVISRFVRPLYAALRDEFRRQVGAPSYSSLGAFDTCFDTSALVSAPSSPPPTVTLHLEGLDLTLPAENTLIHSSATPLACLAMAEAPDNVDSVVNVIASLQQQNLRVLIDTVRSRVGFSRELCN